MLIGDLPASLTRGIYDIHSKLIKNDKENYYYIKISILNTKTRVWTISAMEINSEAEYYAFINANTK